MFGLILAGESGSRLWPLSHELYPKQLLKLNSKKTLLECTYERMMSVVSVGKIIAITNSKNYSDVREQLSKYCDKITILPEPTAKNTAPAISVATKYILDKFKDDYILVMPSDHLIKDVTKFKSSIEKAKELASKGYIVTLTTKPQYPSCGYGYIKIGKKIDDNGFLVDKFKEKPDKKAANRYFKNKKYFWNCGIFVFKASVLLETMKKCAKNIYSITNKFDFKQNEEIKYLEFDKYPNISFDYAILENTKNIAMVNIESDWSDLGSWEAICETNKKDENNNVKIGNVVDSSCKDSLLYSSQRLIAGVGLKDTIIVETPDTILACNKNNVHEVKEVYEKIKQSKSVKLINRTVHRPWGYYTVLDEGDGYLTKLICVSRKGQLSVQSHNFRSEHWVVLSGVARVTLDKKTFMLKAGSSIDIPLKAIHSLSNPYDNELKILEVQKGDKLSEEDIIRYKDIYGRV